MGSWVDVRAFERSYVTIHLDPLVVSEFLVSCTRLAYDIAVMLEAVWGVIWTIVDWIMITLKV